MCLYINRRDEKKQRRLKKDFLRSTSINAQQLVLWMEAGDKMVRDSSKSKSPLLVLHGDDDKVCDFKASETFVQSYGVQDKEFEIMKGYRHDLYNELDREQVFQKIITWINQRLVKYEPLEIKQEQQQVVEEREIKVEPVDEEVKMARSIEKEREVDLAIQTELEAQKKAPKVEEKQEGELHNELVDFIMNIKKPSPEKEEKKPESPRVVETSKEEPQNEQTVQHEKIEESITEQVKEEIKPVESSTSEEIKLEAAEENVEKENEQNEQPSGDQQ
jgi:hypothetical protein